jgi:hypothetical protein
VTVDEFLEKWEGSGANERANTQLFINDLCHLLNVPPPRPARPDTALNDYVFERYVVKKEIDGTQSHGWIDCYKKDAFILEAKQGSEADRKAVERGQGDSLRDLFGQTAEERFKRGMATIICPIRRFFETRRTSRRGMRSSIGIAALSCVTSTENL